jgi:hypothetical protein|tara:strand:+ start:743 stop:1654 length:912 start_codon:yes stop_codon:yes gene_type:complete
MTTELSKIEVVNDNSEIILSYQTLEEKVQALKSLKIKWKEGVIREKDIYLQRGEILRKIVNNKLYKLKYDESIDSFREVQDRKFEDFLKEDSKYLFNTDKPLHLSTANNYQAFYLLYNKVLSHVSIHEPIYINQIKPMTNLILTDIDNAVEVWKGAYDSCKKDYPTHDEVYQAFIVHGPKPQATQRAFNSVKREYEQAVSDKEKTYKEPEVSKPTISISELQKYDGSVDAGLTCKAIASSYHQAKESLSSFKFTLYNFIQKNGIEALNELKNVDVGVYSINDLDIKLKGLEEELIKIKLMLDS